MFAVLKVTLTPAGSYLLKEAGQGMAFNETIGPISEAAEFYRQVARRIAQLSHEGHQVKYIDHGEMPCSLD
jgi:hypothetical protein